MLRNILHELLVVDKSIPIFITNFYHLFDHRGVNCKAAFFIKSKIPFKSDRSSLRYILPF